MAMVVAVLVLLLFALDLVVGFPFQSASRLMDAAFVVCAIVLGYLSWSAFKEIT